MNIQEIEDRILLRELVDKVSMLGDRKDFSAQVELFDDNALSETFAGDTPILRLTGRKAMAEAFPVFLKDFKTVYHLNGQQVVTLEGDSAKGTCYCVITLIKIGKEKTLTTTIGAVYQDEYIRKNNRWLIAKRVGNFEWQEKT